MSPNSPLTRRRFVQALGATTIPALAGCSGGGDTTDPDQEPDSTGTDTPAGSSGDTQHPGENVVEQFLTENGKRWVELEDTSEQVTETPSSSFFAEHAGAFDFQAETVTHETGANEGKTYDVDTAYITLASDDNGWYTQLGYIDASEWREGEGFEGNRFRATAFAGGSTDTSTLETMFADDVTGYSDMSESFPEEFRSLLDQ